MEIVRANQNNLASVLMGKNLQFPWRGQKDVTILIPFNEWLDFVRNNCDLLSNRPVLKYHKLFESYDEAVAIRYFMYDISWAQYSELAMSSGINRDATLILPYFDDGVRISALDLMKRFALITESDRIKLHNNLKSATKAYNRLVSESDLYYGIVDTEKLSQWNLLVLYSCLYLQSKANKNSELERLNIDWR